MEVNSSLFVLLFAMRWWGGGLWREGVKERVGGSRWRSIGAVDQAESAIHHAPMYDIPKDCRQVSRWRRFDQTIDHSVPGPLSTACAMS